VFKALFSLSGAILSLSMAYQMWGWKGFLFTLGLLLAA